MIVSIYLSSEDEKGFSNGINIEINRCDGEHDVTFNIKDDNEKSLLPSFGIDFEELKKAILKLEFKYEN